MKSGLERGKGEEVGMAEGDREQRRGGHRVERRGTVDGCGLLGLAGLLDTGGTFKWGRGREILRVHPDWGAWR